MASTQNELCTVVDGAPQVDVPVVEVASYSFVADQLRAFPCVRPIPGDPLVPGEGQFFRPGGFTTQQIQFDVY